MELLSGFLLLIRELLVGVALALSVLLSGGGTPQTPPPAQPTSSTVPPTSPNITVESPTTTPATSTPVKKDMVGTSTPRLPVRQADTIGTQTPPAPSADPEEVNTNTRKAIVNILCSTANGGPFRPISGSGVVIDPRGVILTNAHIGQYFLLRDYPAKNSTECIIRTGTPARPAYRATLMYLPPAWIEDNADQIISEQGLGTGENDYAFLRITEPTDPNGTLPFSYPYVAMTGTTPDTGDGILIAGYPAGFLDGITIEKSLYATSAFSAVGQLYSFNKTSSVDVVSVGNTVVTQGGASGGAVVRTHDGKLTGIVATATAGTTTSSRDLRAITLSHIDRSLRSFGRGGLAEFLSSDPSAAAIDFASTTFQQEKQQLIQVIAPQQ